MLFELLLIVAVALIVHAVYKRGTISNEYFRRRGIKSLKPTFLIGNSGVVLFQKTTAVELANIVYSEFPNEP